MREKKETVQVRELVRKSEKGKQKRTCGFDIIEATRHQKLENAERNRACARNNGV